MTISVCLSGPVLGPCPRQVHAPPPVPAALSPGVAWTLSRRPSRQSAWQRRAATPRAAPGEPGAPAGGAGEPRPPSTRGPTGREATQTPAPPSGMSGGIGTGPFTQSELAANAAAEATVAEAEAAAAAAARHRPPSPSPQPKSYKISDLRANPRISEALDAAAAIDTAAAAAADEPAVTAPPHLHPHHAGRSIEELRTHPHEFTCEEPNTCGGTIVVALDDTDDSAAAVEWVAEHMYTPDVDELRIVHVVCDPRTLQWQTSLGTTSSGRNISISSLDLGLSPQSFGGSYGGVEVNLHDYLARLNDAAKAVVKRRCSRLREKGLQFEEELPRLEACRSAAGIAETLLESVRRNDAKLLVVASHGPGALAEFGSVSRFCYQHAQVPLLLIPSIEAQAAATAAAARSAAALPSVPAPAPAEGAAAAAGSGQQAAAATPPRSEILLVVNHLEELANVWQWVADNCAHKGDALSIWHVAGPSLSGMPSLPTAIANQLRGRGMGDVSYRQLYSSTGDPQDLGEQVCGLAASNPAVKLVVLLNYSRRGLIQEAMHGSVASHLSRHCPKPLLLLQLPE